MKLNVHCTQHTIKQSLLALLRDKIYSYFPGCWIILKIFTHPRKSVNHMYEGSDFYVV